MDIFGSFYFSGLADSVFAFFMLFTLFLVAYGLPRKSQGYRRGNQFKLKEAGSILIPKYQRLTQVKFAEGVDSNEIPMQLKSIGKEVKFNVSGPITITAKVGTILKIIQAAADGTTIVPYLLFVLGGLTFSGQVNDAKSKGLVCQNFPIWLLWLEDFLLNNGNGPIVDDGGMAAAGFAVGTYNVNINFAFKFYDPMMPVSQQNATYFRPTRFNSKPFWTITGGYLFQTNYQATNDNVATTGDTSTAGALTYNPLSALTISATAVIVPSLKFSANDICGDFQYDYQNKTLGGNATGANFNAVELASRGFQQWLYMLFTNVVNAGAGGNTSKVEQGFDGFGLAQNGLVETDAGEKQLTYAYAQNLKAIDQDTLMAGQSVIPTGLLVINEGGHNWTGWQNKTFLKTGAPAHLINSNGTPTAPGGNIYGSSVRFINKVINPSSAALASVTLGDYAGE